MTAALGSGSAPLPSMPQPRPRAPRLILGSAPSRFEATRQPSRGRPKAAESAPQPTYRYVQLDAEQNISEVSEALRQGGGPANGVKRQRAGGEADAPADEPEDEAEPVDYQEVRLVPASPL
jgi:hypothetical protein